MGKIPYFWVFMGLVLAACTDGGSPSAGHINMRPEGMTPGRNPDTDVIRNSNYKVTGMIVTNDTQVDNYIAGKLRGSAWENKTPDNTLIANAAIEIASGEYSTYDDNRINYDSPIDIETVHAVVYVDKQHAGQTDIEYKFIADAYKIFVEKVNAP